LPPVWDRYCPNTGTLAALNGMIKVKIGHSTQQKIRCLRPFLGHRAQFESRHPYVSRHALDFRLIAQSEIRFGAALEPSSTPRQQRLQRGLALSSLG
jgi:hypothetical protein